MHQLQITSAVFSSGGFIPAKYTCDGQDINPPLQIGDLPEGVKSVALIVDDPDAPAGTWTHWVVFNIPPEQTQVAEDSVPTGAVLGGNDFKRTAWGGPCPPSGTHRYVFTVYALSKKLELADGASRSSVESAMRGAILGQGQVIGLYQKK